MAYIISTSSSVGAASFTRDTIKEALEKVLELMGMGMKDVHILDEDGYVHAAPFEDLGRKMVERHADRT